VNKINTQSFPGQNYNNACIFIPVSQMEQKKQHDQLTQEKTSAALAALQLVKDGMVLGLGSGVNS
jgi:DeoR/GlpR family transcriptional regulator of sugar metabolism